VFDGPSKVIDAGVRRRLFTGATRTAVLIRDRGCTHPSCDTPMDRCQVDHVHPYADGGLTTQDNGEGKCGFHNLLKGRTPPPAA
jgi:5-methylcytosine-specific restriction endonuclease McrA